MKEYPSYRSTRVDWMARIPSHWDVVPLGVIAEITNGFPFDSKKFDSEHGYQLIRIRDIFSMSTETKYNGEWVEAASIASGDVLIGMDGDFNVAIWRGEKALLNQRVCCVRTEDANITRFLYYILPTPLKITNKLTYATTVKHLSIFDVLKYRIALPSSKEIEQIVCYLDTEIMRIDNGSSCVPGCCFAIILSMPRRARQAVAFLAFGHCERTGKS